MRRLMATVLMVGLVTVGGSASAGRSFVEEKDYSGSQGFSMQDQVNAYWTNLLGEIPQSVAPAGARTVSVKITDQTGQPIAGHIHVDHHGDGKKVKSFDICAETPAPLPLGRHSMVEVLVVSGTCGTDLSLPTSGTVTFTYGR